MNVSIRFAFVGSVLRNQFGEWIVGFNRILSDYSVFDVELSTIRDVLLMLQENGYIKALIQTYCLEVVKAVQDGYLGTSNLTLLRQIQQIL